MTIKLWNFSSETIYVQEVSFIAKGFTTKLFLRVFLNSVIYQAFPIQNFYVYSILVCYIHMALCTNNINTLMQVLYKWKPAVILFV